jgi:2-keto-4-pentenoate hydratase/2-oxohepta-3-ene-1,7-dioic acid hydratase in catechol pathway
LFTSESLLEDGLEFAEIFDGAKISVATFSLQRQLIFLKMAETTATGNTGQIPCSINDCQLKFKFHHHFYVSINLSKQNLEFCIVCFQDSNTGQLVFGVAAIISWISQFATLLPGKIG